MKKKVGKVRVMPPSGTGDAPRSHPPRAADSKPDVTLLPKKKVGRVKAEVGRSIYHKQPCCDGEFKDGGMWIHSPRCSQTAVLWKAHGKTKEDWYCEDGCPGVDIGEAITHHYDCAWWDRNATYQNVPFGQRKPKESGQGEIIFGALPAAASNDEAGDDEDDDLPF